jgi:hypothetical protein
LEKNKKLFSGKSSSSVGVRWSIVDVRGLVRALSWAPVKENNRKKWEKEEKRRILTAKVQVKCKKLLKSKIVFSFVDSRRLIAEDSRTGIDPRRAPSP